MNPFDRIMTGLQDVEYAKGSNNDLLQALAASGKQRVSSGYNSLNQASQSPPVSRQNKEAKNNYMQARGAYGPVDTAYDFDYTGQAVDEPWEAREARRRVPPDAVHEGRQTNKSFSQNPNKPYRPNMTVGTASAPHPAYQDLPIVKNGINKYGGPIGRIPALAALLGGAAFAANPTVAQAAEIGAGFTPMGHIAEWLNPQGLNEVDDVANIKAYRGR